MVLKTSWVLSKKKPKTQKNTATHKHPNQPEAEKIGQQNWNKKHSTKKPEEDPHNRLQEKKNRAKKEHISTAPDSQQQ